MDSVANIIRSVYRANCSDIDKLNILTICRNNEKYISSLCKTKHNFYILQQHPWNNLIEQRPSTLQMITSYCEPLDYIICYDRAEQYEEALQIATQLHIPIILIDMCSKNMIRPHTVLEQFKPIDTDTLRRQVVLQVFSNNHIANSWGNSETSIVIPIGIDSNKFHNHQILTDQCVISMDNNTPPHIGTQIQQQLKQYPIIPTDHQNLTDIAVNKSQYFINTYQTITVKTLEAMSAGNVVICLKNTDTENFINHEETGMLINSLNDLSATIDLLEKSKTLRIKIAEQARAKIIAEHSIDVFISKWLSAFNMIKSTFYTPTPIM